jgi:hypothetical protein
LQIKASRFGARKKSKTAIPYESTTWRGYGFCSAVNEGVDFPNSRCPAFVHK